MSEEHLIRVLFICTGNICRSPMAEGVLLAKLHERGLEHRFQVDSAAIVDHNVGDAPDRRAAEIALKHNIDIRHLVARQVTLKDFEEFDFILAMDRNHLNQLKAMAPEPYQAKIKLFLEYTEEEMKDIPDPYYDSINAFESVFDLINRGAESLINHF